MTKCALTVHVLTMKFDERQILNIIVVRGQERNVLKFEGKHQNLEKFQGLLGFLMHKSMNSDLASN